MSSLLNLSLDPIRFTNGSTQQVTLHYEIFGCPIHTAPVVFVLHALTGNSTVTGENGWWKALIGAEKTIDTNRYTIVAFNIPGNGRGKSVLDWENWSTYDVAHLYWQGIDALQLTELFAVIGGSLGGGIAWEMAFQRPHAINYLIPIASHWKATDWIIGNVLIQQQILKNSTQPVHDARIHAMFLYRTPESITQKFQGNRQTDGSYQTESWLLHHGNKLTERFSLHSYQLMNHLLKTIGANQQWNDLKLLAQHKDLEIHQISIDTDLFFTANAIEETAIYLRNCSTNSYLHQISSIHGHDAFLIETAQLDSILTPIFGLKSGS
ncbi:alpha/beta fold hydrolase [Flavobacterium sp. HSC-61S13]|uniref:alpha/beta fold hydrolase n=1 Tax=Flavobacterium sp. HSC-61S13 TaxID=2910963 RepID=UPI00209E00AB|nr:alpha/beta fold hydrolase [Flavobacterium sp. HSC-61S13]MCP1995351.1 homoserine O-acetyltransferase [Flavobacterium sp. HSC-61S13]